MGELKLFVVGASSGNPDEWEPWNDRAIVVAHDAQEAMRMAEIHSNDVAEISLETPKLIALCEGRELNDPEWG